MWLVVVVVLSQPIMPTRRNEIQRCGHAESSSSLGRCAEAERQVRVGEQAGAVY